MNSKLLKVKEKEAINKFIASLFFVIIFVYYLNYPSESSKGYLLIRGTEGVLRLEYGFWGYLNDISYKFLDFISGDLITGNFLILTFCKFNEFRIFIFIFFDLVKFGLLSSM